MEEKTRKVGSKFSSDDADEIFNRLDKLNSNESKKSNRNLESQMKDVAELLGEAKSLPDDKAVDVLQKSGFIAVSYDGLWYANSSYLKSEFECDAYSFENLVPLYYNEKVAYITSLGDPSIKEILFAHDDEITFPIDYYYIDFKNNRVRKVTYRYLSELLEDYHDLQMRFEGMKDYKKRYMVEEFFFNYIERATDDVLRPYILDLVE